ncbi:MAG TPA: DUF3298 and DUF4163 domain-containing protein [Polyangiaceae bacterium]|nr:DUF3298 and DUF4163 domain-containing protein [Polyangiaceae bacterium]
MATPLRRAGLGAALALLTLAACKRDAPPPSERAAPSAAPSGGAGGAAASAPSAPWAVTVASAPKPAGPRETIVSALRGGPRDEAWWLHLERQGDALRGHLVKAAGSSVTELRGAMRDERLFAVSEVGRKGPASAVEGEIEGGKIVKAALRGGKGKPVALRPGAPDALDVAKAYERGFQGTIGELRVRAQIGREGKRVTGFYRYRKSRDDLKLDGSVDPSSGKFELQEAAPDGTIVGHLQGTFLGPDHLAGVWESPDGARKLPLWLAAAAPLERVRGLPGGAKMIPREARHEPAPFCEEGVSYPEFDGLPDRRAQAALNRSLAPKGAPKASECEGATKDAPYEWSQGYEVLSDKRPGFVSIAFGSYSYLGGAHGTWGSDCEVIDLKRGRRLRLRELLAPGARAGLTALANAKLRAEHGPDLTEAGFFNPEIEVSEAPNLCLLDGAVELRFAIYEIAPYVMGETTVELSFDELKRLTVGEPIVDSLLR